MRITIDISAASVELLKRIAGTESRSMSRQGRIFILDGLMQYKLKNQLTVTGTDSETPRPV